MVETPEGLRGWPLDVTRRLVLCNGAVCLLVVGWEWWLWGGEGGARREQWWWREVVPSVVVYAVVFAGTRELRPVDVQGLEGMRYEYKGA